MRLRLLFFLLTLFATVLVPEGAVAKSLEGETDSAAHAESTGEAEATKVESAAYREVKAGDEAKTGSPKEEEAPAEGSGSEEQAGPQTQPENVKNDCGKDERCFLAGTLVAVPSQSHASYRSCAGEMPIESLNVGDRVLSTDAQDQKSDTQVDPATWKTIKLTLNDRGDQNDLVLLRSPQWCEANHVTVGGKIWFEMPDIDLSGWGTVTDVGRAPPLADGNGRVVTSTVTHLNHEVRKLTVSGFPSENRCPFSVQNLPLLKLSMLFHL